MASRMDRYRVGEGRSSRNQDIYKQLEEVGNYTNIEGIANIEDNNEIDISKIKEMLKNRENYQKEKRYKDLLSTEEKVETLQDVIEEKEENHDIVDILSDALKSRNVMENDNHKFEISKYEIIKEMIDKKNKDNESNEEKNELSDNLLDDLIGGKEEKELTIKQVIDDAKEEEPEKDEEMDKTFFTNSLNLTGSDFENLKEIQTDIKKNNRLLKIVSFALAITIVAILLLLLFK